MPSPDIRFRATPPLGDILEARTASAGRLDISEVARRDLIRYYHLLQESLPADAFEVAELATIYAATANAILDGDTYRFLWAEVDDACEHEGADKEWGADRQTLVAKIRRLSPCQTLALLDAMERVSVMQEEREDWVHDLRADFHSVGLLTKLVDDETSDEKGGAA
jgi:hypothetical protein